MLNNYISKMMILPFPYEKVLVIEFVQDSDEILGHTRRILYIHSRNYYELNTTMELLLKINESRYRVEEVMEAYAQVFDEGETVHHLFYDKWGGLDLDE